MSCTRGFPVLLGGDPAYHIDSIVPPSIGCTYHNQYIHLINTMKIHACKLGNIFYQKKNKNWKYYFRLNIISVLMSYEIFHVNICINIVDVRTFVLFYIFVNFKYEQFIYFYIKIYIEILKHSKTV